MDEDYDIVDETPENIELAIKKASSGTSWKTYLTQKTLLVLDSVTSTTLSTSFLLGKSNSSIANTGKLTPDEFVLAGDYLVFNYPSWEWASGTHHRSILPVGKQFLITKNVPCLPPSTLGSNEDEWVNVDEKSNTTTKKNGINIGIDIKSNGFMDLDDDDAYVDDNDQDDVVATKTYDVYITYDAHYSTPRVWLFGYNKNNEPMTGAEWQQDFSPEHVNKTVTYEVHPHLNMSCPTVHPCNHANAMLSIIKHLFKNKFKEEHVKYYIVIFLKIIQTIIPNIEFDYTGDLNSKNIR